jgi:hypothetical protein
LYDRAAEKDTANPLRFSPDAMEYLRQLEQNAFEEAVTKV